MLVEVTEELFRAECERCSTFSPDHGGSRAVAVLRLMRDGWRVNQRDDAVATLCPACASTSGPPSTP